MLVLPSVLAAPLLLAAAVSDAPKLTIESCEFGEVYAFHDVECQFDVQNTGDKPVRVIDAIPSRPGDKALAKGLVIAPHSHAYLPVQLKTENGTGYNQHPFRLRTDDGLEYGANAHGFVMSVLDQTHPEIDFGVVESDGSEVDKTIALSSAEAPNFRLTKVMDAPAWVNAHIQEDGHTLRANVRHGADWGIATGFVKLQTNNEAQKEVWVAVKSDIRGAIVPAFNPLDVGLLHMGDNNTFRIPLHSKTDRPFEINSAKLEGAVGEVKAVPCEPVAADCRWLEVKIADAQGKGFVKGTVRVTFPHEKATLSVDVRGFLVDKDFVAKTIDESTLRGESATGAPAAGSSVLPLQNAIANAVRQSNETVPPGNGPLLRWHVANGRSIHGFQIFRGESEQGPFVLLNRPTLPSSAEDEESAGYNYRDNSAESGKTYWYYIGLVFNDGRKQQLTGPQKIVAK